MTARVLREKLQKLGNKEKAEVLQRFFKTRPGEYGEGDVFLGIQVPQLRKLAKQYKSIAVAEVTQLLVSPVHEERLLALLLCVYAYAKGDEVKKKEIYTAYLNNTKFVNNWDLVDTSAEHIVGAYLAKRSRKPLYRLAKSTSLWERRIAIMATFHFIKQNEFSETVTLAEMLLTDEEDLIHKAVGWMLCDIGKRDLEAEEKFLKEHYRTMPRTMLRYAIEKFPETKRKRYLKGEV
jgi:3-methyladenine DNA glycosylase AlkD